MESNMYGIKFKTELFFFILLLYKFILIAYSQNNREVPCT